MTQSGPLGRSRVTRVVAYLLAIAAGAILPGQIALIDPDSKWLWLVMCGWMILGGIFSGVGQVTQRWVGEFVGLPLLASSMLGFGFLQANLVGWHVSVWPSTALLWAFGLMYHARWRDVTVLYRAARQGVEV